MLFVEFIEFFARMAEAAYKDDPNLRNAELIEKIKCLMDHMFPLVGQKRMKVNVEIEYISVSEEELDEDKYYV